MDFNKNEPVWVITDGSQTGIGAMYGQGKNWDTGQPAGFLSKKFMSAQHNYHTHEYETLAVRFLHFIKVLIIHRRTLTRYIESKVF